MKKGNIVELPQAEVYPLHKSLAKDAASIRRICVKTLRDFRRGTATVSEAGHTARLAKMALEAMKVEYLASPRIEYQEPELPDDEDD